MKYLFKSKYYKKILAALLLVNLIPILFLGGSIANLVNQQRKALNHTIESSIKNQMNEVETSFRYVENAMIRMALGGAAQMALRTDLAAQNFQLFNSLRSELQLIGNSEQQLDDVLMINKSRNWIIGTSTCMALTKYEEAGTINMLFSMPHHSFWYTDSEFIYLVKRLPIYTMNGNGMLTAKFQKSMLGPDIIKTEDGYETVVLDEEGNVIFGDSLDTLIVQEILSHKESAESLRQGNVLTMNYKGGSYILSAKVSDYNKWSYIFVTTNSAFKKSISHVMAMLALVAAGMILVDGCVIYIISKRLYMPIHEIDSLVGRKIHADQGDTNLESDDMELLSKVRYILKKNTELQKMVEHKDESSQQLFLRKLYRGEKIDFNEDILIKQHIVKRRLNGTNMYLMALKFKHHFETEEDRQLYLFALDNVANELLNKEECFPLVTIGKIIYVTYFVNADSNESADLKIQTIATMLIGAVEKYMNMTINIGISNAFQQVEHIVPAVEECERALRDAMGFDGICNFFRYPQRESMVPMGHEIHQARKRVIQALDAGEREQCSAGLDHYLGLIKDVQYCIFKLEICKLVSEILNYYAEYALNPDYAAISDIIDYDIGKKVSSIETLRVYLWKFLLDELFKNICDKAEQNDVIYQIAEYLNENIECDINLEDCARHFNYNASYLSRMFKKNFGKTYTDYVTEKKMEKCKELLRHTDISVNDLAERFGYSSPQNFIRVFKKYTLLTPGQFRKEGKGERGDWND